MGKRGLRNGLWGLALLTMIAILARQPGPPAAHSSHKAPLFTLNGVPAPLEFLDIDSGLVQFYYSAPWLVHLREQRPRYDFRVEGKVLYLENRCIGWSGEAPPGASHPWGIHVSKLNSPKEYDP